MECTNLVCCVCIIEIRKACMLPLKEPKKLLQKNIRLLDHRTIETPRKPLKTLTKDQYSRQRNCMCSMQRVCGFQMGEMKNGWQYLYSKSKELGRCTPSFLQRCAPTSLNRGRYAPILWWVPPHQFSRHAVFHSNLFWHKFGRILMFPTCVLVLRVFLKISDRLLRCTGFLGIVQKFQKCILITDQAPKGLMMHEMSYVCNVKQFSEVLGIL